MSKTPNLRKILDAQRRLHEEEEARELEEGMILQHQEILERSRRGPGPARHIHPDQPPAGWRRRASIPRARAR